MTELKPVPSGYDSSALSSMMSYLANARRSHDNNPGMRMLLDREMRDNKQEYLADADLTVRAQAEDNDYTKQYNLAKMAQDAYDARAGRGVDMSRISGGALTPEIVSEDLNLGSQSGDSIAQVQQSMIDAQLLKVPAARADINRTYAQTDEANMNVLEGGQRIGSAQVDDGQMDEYDIANPTRKVRPDPEMMPANMRAMIEADAMRDAAKITQNNKTTQPGIIGEDGKWQAIDPDQAESLKSQGKKVIYGLVTDNTETKTTGGRSGVKIADPAKDVNTAIEMAKAKGIDVKGSGIDANGAYVTDASGQKLYPRPKKKQE